MHALIRASLRCATVDRILASLAVSALSIAFLTITAAPAAAQMSQYTAPGTLLERGTSKKEQLEKATDSARWHLGPFRASPWVSLKDAAYVSDVFAGTITEDGERVKEEPDFTLTAGLGVQGFLPLGGKSYFTLDILPQYVYWQKQDERRRLNGYYGAGLYGFFNRLTLQAVARRAEEQGVISSEVEQRIHSRQDLVSGVAELRIGRAVYLFGSASGLEFVPLVEDLGGDPRLPAFGDLQRQEQVLRGGVEYRPHDQLRFAVGFERSDVEFEDTARDRSNSGTAPILEASYERDSVRVAAAVAQRSLEPKDGSEFAPFDQTTGRLQVTLIPRWRLNYSLYAGRDFAYSVEPGYSHFTVDRFGGSIGMKIGRSSSADVFVEKGVHDYAVIRGAGGTGGVGLPDREDDFGAFGGALHLSLGQNVRLNIGAQRTELDSGLPGTVRRLTVIQSSLEFSAFGGAFTIR